MLSSWSTLTSANPLQQSTGADKAMRRCSRTPRLAFHKNDTSIVQPYNIHSHPQPVSSYANTHFATISSDTSRLVGCSILRRRDYTPPQVARGTWAGGWGAGVGGGGGLTLTTQTLRASYHTLRRATSNNSAGAGSFVRFVTVSSRACPRRKIIRCTRKQQHQQHQIRNQ